MNSLIDQMFCLTGVPLLDGRAGEECEALSETAAAEYTDHHVTLVAGRRR